MCICGETSPLRRDHLVYGEFTLKAGKLTFQAGGDLLAYDARQALGRRPRLRPVEVATHGGRSHDIGMAEVLQVAIDDIALGA